MSLVEVSVSTLTQLKVRSTTDRNVASSAAEVNAASVKIIAIMVAMSGSIMPTPFATPTTVAAPAVAAAVLGTVSVVMMPAGDGVRIRARQRRRYGGDTGADPVDRVDAADDAGGRDEHVGRCAAECGGHPGDHFFGIGHALRARGDVRVLGDHDDGAGRPVGDVAPADEHARPGERALGEHAGGSADGVRGHDGEVVGVVLHPDVRDVRAKALGQRQDHDQTVWATFRWSLMRPKIWPSWSTPSVPSGVSTWRRTLAT